MFNLILATTLLGSPRGSTIHTVLLLPERCKIIEIDLVTRITSVSLSPCFSHELKFLFSFRKINPHPRHNLISICVYVLESRCLTSINPHVANPTNPKSLFRAVQK
jgi:hypothetical protein